MMRIVTWNIHGWKTIDQQPNLLAVGEALAAINADIIGLNEVFYPQQVTGSDKPALQALAERLGLHFVFGPCLRWPAQDVMPANAYGNALLSRWPIIASSAHHLTPKEEDGSNLLAEKEQRGLLEGRILLPDNRTLTIYVTHLDHTDEEARLIQLRVARTWLGRDRNRPHFVLGDFNAISTWDFTDRPADWNTLAQHEKGKQLCAGEKGPHLIAQLEKIGYHDLYRQFGQPGISSFPPADPAIRLDYIFASQTLASMATMCTIVEGYDGISDHRPLLASVPFTHVTQHYNG